MCTCGGSSTQVTLTVGNSTARGARVLGDDVRTQRARKTAAAMCIACPHAKQGEARVPVAPDVWRVSRGVVGCHYAPDAGVPPVALDRCPRGVWDLGRGDRVWWRGFRWVGVPAPRRRLLAFRGVRPRAEPWHGCGCLAALKLFWLRLRRLAALPHPSVRPNATLSGVRVGGL